MIKTLPDKWIRKAVYDAVNNMEVSGKNIPCFDTYVPRSEDLQAYILMTTQTNSVERVNKCEDQYLSSVLLDIVTRYSAAGNTGNRVLADDILDKARENTNSLTLDSRSNLSIVWQKQDFPNDLPNITKNEIVLRKFMRIEFYIN